MTIVKMNDAFRDQEEEVVEPESSSDSSDSSDTEVSSSDSGSSGSESDSAMESDEKELQLSPQEEPSAGLYQVNNETCTLPDEMFDFNDLSEILSVDTWNNCLSEEERFGLSSFLPDMDKETFAHTLSDLFAGKNFHFGSPMSTLFTQLKGGLCDPDIVLYRRGSRFLQRRKYYLDLQNYHNSFLGNLIEINEAWQNCKGYNMQERLEVLNNLRTQKSLGYHGNEEGESEFESETDSENLKTYSRKKGKVKFEKDVKSEPVKIKEKVPRYDNYTGTVPNNYRTKKSNPNQAVTDAFYEHDIISQKGKFVEKPDFKNTPRYDKPMQALPIEQPVKLYSKNSCKNSSKEVKQEINLPIKREYNEISREIEPFKGKKKSKLIESTTNQEVQLVKRVYIPVSSNNVKLPPVESYTLERKHKPVLDPPVNFDAKPRANKTKEINLGSSVTVANNEGRPYRKSGYEDNAEKSVPPVLPITSCATKKSRGKNINNNSINNNNNNNPVQMEKRVDPFDSKLGLDPNPIPEETYKAKKKVKRKLDQVQEPVPEPVLLETIVPEPIPVPEPEKPVKKQYTLITPTIHTGFSFSIIHLLSAIRKAMISPLEEDNTGTKSRKEKETSSPSLTVQEIVNRIKKNPGDPFILETQEPLQDLVRGVLRIFASKTAPLGAKGWKQLVCYERVNKTWTWIGPVNPVSTEADPIEEEEEETSSDTWAIPHKMLVKLVDAFANWLKSGQETLQQIGSLPAPPASILSSYDEKERFKDLRAQKSLNTITATSDEVKDYFRKEEALRYSIPDRAFSYTAYDGKKTIVAPLRRGGGKPTSKARDHFMLKPNRPPHVTILCLVRDATARLPGSIGTRADVCTLLRDSQYIVEDVSDAQVNQVVSGALDRLHYERDPCVQFDGERKLWVYLHREREEEDFEDDGTSSTKKWKRPRKDDNGSGLDMDGNPDPDLYDRVEEKFDVTPKKVATIGTVSTVSGTGTDNSSVITIPVGVKSMKTNTNTNSNTNTNTPRVSLVSVGTSAGTARTGMGTVGTSTSVGTSSVVGIGTSTVGTSGSTVGSGTGRVGLSGTVGTSLGGAVKMVCHENSTNDDFDDEEYGRGERLFGAILL